MKPDERIYLNDFYQLHGLRTYGDEWNDLIIHFLNSKSPTLIGFSDHEISTAKEKGDKLNKRAVENANKIEAHFREHLDKIFLLGDHESREPYKAEIIAYDFINSKCINIKGEEHACEITLKPSSEFIDNKSIQLFDPNVSKTLSNNNKAVLVSKAVLVYFSFYGIPSNRKTLIGKIQDGYQEAYGQSVKDNLVYDAIAVMSDFWINRPEN